MGKVGILRRSAVALKDIVFDFLDNSPESLYYLSLNPVTMTKFSSLFNDCFFFSFIVITTLTMNIMMHVNELDIEKTNAREVYPTLVYSIKYINNSIYTKKE